MEAYYDVREPGSYGGVDSQYKTMKRKGEPITYKQAAKWLTEQDAYTLHKPVQRRFSRRKTYSRGIDYLWQADLVHIDHLSEQNEHSTRCTNPYDADFLVEKRIHEA